MLTALGEVSSGGDAIEGAVEGKRSRKRSRLLTSTDDQFECVPKVRTGGSESVECSSGSGREVQGAETETEDLSMLEMSYKCVHCPRTFQTEKVR